MVYRASLELCHGYCKAIVKSDEPEDQQLIHDMVWMHDYPKMMGDNDNYERMVSKEVNDTLTDS